MGKIGCIQYPCACEGCGGKALYGIPIVFPVYIDHFPTVLTTKVLVISTKIIVQPLAA